jgi:hypothetical protein
MPPAEEMVRRAEQDVLAAAKEWALEAWDRENLTPAEQKLKMAVFMLKKSSSLSGQYRLTMPVPSDEQK